MHALMQQVNSVASAHVAILLTGDNGTGKSQLASYIHAQSRYVMGLLLRLIWALFQSLYLKVKCLGTLKARSPMLNLAA